MSTGQTKNTIYIIPIEPIDQRYTKQWYENIPQLVKDASNQYEVITVDGVTVADVTTRGAFLDFALTNAYKASQVEKVSWLFSNNLVKPGDRFLFTDAWHFGIPAVKYMSELLNIPVELHGIWHAGAYDPTDILGMKMSCWANSFEYSLYYALDFSYFATDFHKDMFLKNLWIPEYDWPSAVRSGQPHTPIIQPLLELSVDHKKLDFIMFPHRLNSDKQPNIAYDLRNHFNIQMTQEKNLSKAEYYETLAQAKIIFSCSLHENLGISVMEGVLAGCLPVVPDRASYREMYLPEFRYPSEWTESHDAYCKHRDNVIDFIKNLMDNYDRFYFSLVQQRNILIDKYLSAKVMIETLTR